MSVLFGLALAAAAAFDWETAAKSLAFIAICALHMGVSTPLAGLVVAYRKNHRWSIPWWIVGGSVLGLMVYKIDQFMVDKLALASWSDGIYIALAVVSTLIGFFVVWARTEWDFAAIKDLAWDVFSGVAGFLGGITLLILPMAVQADDRQTDVDDQVPQIPTLAGWSGKYVALGDSYSAGEGIDPFQPGSPRNCDRSPYAYPLLLKFEHSMDIDFEACSGAVSQDIDLGIHGGSEPQIPSGLGRDESVTLVTITVGGNDVILSDIVTHCFLYENCLERRFEPREAHPGKYTIDYPEPQELDSWIEAALPLLRGNLDRVYDRIDEAYPRARVVVLGYPDLFPVGDAPAPWRQLDCASILRRVDKPERQELHDRVHVLNEVLYDLATEHEFDFISPAAAWAGYEACGNEGQYTNAVRPGWKLASPVDGATLHPNVRGQQQYARLISCYLNANPERPAHTPIAPGAIGNPITCG